MSTGGEVANALVCKTSIRGFNSRPVLQHPKEKALLARRAFSFSGNPQKGAPNNPAPFHRSVDQKSYRSANCITRGSLIRLLATPRLPPVSPELMDAGSKRTVFVTL